MTQEDIIALVIIGVFSLAIIAMAITLLLGRGVWMVAGYNTMPAAKQVKRNRVALCKFIGKTLLLVGLILPLAVSGKIFNVSWLSGNFRLFAIGGIIFTLIYERIGNRFMK